MSIDGACADDHGHGHTHGQTEDHADGCGCDHCQQLDADKAANTAANAEPGAVGGGEYVLHGSRWNGAEPGLGGGTVSWGFDALEDGPRMDQAGYRASIAAAFSVWDAAADIDFDFVGNSQSAQITLGWRSLDGDGAGGKVAIASWSHLPAGGTLDEIQSVNIVFDIADFPFEATDAEIDDGYFYQTALHEIGHALGLGHSENPLDIMFASVALGKKDLTQGDLDGIVHLYGAPMPVTLPQPSAPEIQFPPEQTTQLRFNGTDADDRFEGGALNELILMRFGNDIVSGGGGADGFLFDGRYVRDGDAHQIIDLSFEDGDTLVFRSFEDGSRTAASQADLTALIQSGYLELAQSTQGSVLALSTAAGATMTLSLSDVIAIQSEPQNEPPEPPAPQEPQEHQVFNGTAADDIMIGGSAVDWFLLRYGNDSAQGNDGADLFVVDSRYVTPGDAHVITDLDFDQGDVLALRGFGGQDHTLRDIEDLRDLLDETAFGQASLDDGLQLVGEDFTLDLIGDGFEFV